MLESLFDKVAGLIPATLLKKRLQQRCFPMNFAKFLRTTFLQNPSGLSRALPRSKMTINDVQMICEHFLVKKNNVIIFILERHLLTKVSSMHGTLETRIYFINVLFRLIWLAFKLCQANFYLFGQRFRQSTQKVFQLL